MHACMNSCISTILTKCAFLLNVGSALIFCSIIPEIKVISKIKDDFHSSMVMHPHKQNFYYLLRQNSNGKYNLVKWVLVDPSSFGILANKYNKPFQVNVTKLEANKHGFM